MIDDVVEVGETTVMVKSAGCMREKPFQGRSPVPLIRRSESLKVVDADLLGGVKIPTRLGEQRWHVAACALCRAIEKRFTAVGGPLVETVRRWPRSGNSKLIEVQGRQFRRYQVR